MRLSEIETQSQLALAWSLLDGTQRISGDSKGSIIIIDYRIIVVIHCYYSPYLYLVPVLKVQ